MKKRKTILMGILITGLLVACSTPKQVSQSQSEEYEIQSTMQTTQEQNESEDEKVDWSKHFKGLEIAKSNKGRDEANPIMTQTYGADPYAMEYNGRVYFYMTADEYEKDAYLNVKENSYSKIKTIRVVSTDDMVNFTDHGSIQVAGKSGAAKWANNSWAPAAAHKNINGKEKFFLYFADNGSGIGVLSADSPTGPWVDPIGKQLISRSTPTCDTVEWLFDPAVLVDDDGTGYIYFGGGVPAGRISNPGTARVAQLGDDMISIVGEPKIIEPPYLFEDSGIHKYNNKYYYTYCTNWQVDQAGTDKYGFTNAEIACMESDSPMGPFTYKETILDNPGKRFGLYGNNHHCVFQFKNQWYMTYHTRQLEKERGIEKGYRCTHINAFNINEDGSIGRIKQTIKGCEQLKYVNPYVPNLASNIAMAGGDIKMIGADAVSHEEKCGHMAVSGIRSGDYIQIRGVDFEKMAPKKLTVTMKKIADVDEDCAIQINTAGLNGNVLGYIPVGSMMNDNADAANDYYEYTVELDKQPEGVTDLYFIFSGSGYAIDSWVFTDTDDWYTHAIEESLLSTGTNGRLEKVINKLENGEKVSVAFIGGSVTEGAGAADIRESYADRVTDYLKTTYQNADIKYVNAGLGGTPSALGVMRYDRDIVEALGEKPDIVFVEFAVNDYQEETNGRAYESLVKTILEGDEDTAVVLVYAVFKTHWNLQDTYIPVGDYYGLPMVSAKNTIDFAYEKNKLNDKDYFSDEYHPTSYGHKIMADCIKYMFEQTAIKNRDVITSEIPKEAKIGTDFQNIHLVTAADKKGASISKGSFESKDTQVHGFMRDGHCAFPENWMYEGNGLNKPFEITLNCKNLLLNFKQSGSEEFGTAVISIDGKVVREINAYAQGGWNQSIVALVLDEKESDKHVISIKMKEGEENKKFTILGLAYTE